jgi:hypothetical protein
MLVVGAEEAKVAKGWWQGGWRLGVIRLDGRVDGKSSL